MKKLLLMLFGLVSLFGIAVAIERSKIDEREVTVEKSPAVVAKFDWDYDDFDQIGLQYGKKANCVPVYTKYYNKGVSLYCEESVYVWLTMEIAADGDSRDANYLVHIPQAEVLEMELVEIDPENYTDKWTIISAYVSQEKIYVTANSKYLELNFNDQFHNNVNSDSETGTIEIDTTYKEPGKVLIQLYLYDLKEEVSSEDGRMVGDTVVNSILYLPVEVNVQDSNLYSYYELLPEEMFGKRYQVRGIVPKQGVYYYN